MSLDFPDLYDSADEAATVRQKTYLRLIRSEYALLILAAVFSLSLSTSALYNIAWASLFVFSACILLFRVNRKPEQGWYKCRALAESIKTTSWRYAMRAQPFNSADVQVAKQAYLTRLHEILADNRQIGETIAGLERKKAETTVNMDEVRNRSISERKKFYSTYRVNDQLSWYTTKSKWNKTRALAWSSACIVLHIVAIIFVLSRIAYPTEVIWPTSVLTVSASSILGWMQVKRYNELASAYALTAHEIRIAQASLPAEPTAEQFSEFVNEAELAFSREHTQWAARRLG